MYSGLTLQDDEEWQHLKATKDSAEHQVYDTQSRISSLIQDIAMTQARIEALQDQIANTIAMRENIKHEIICASQLQVANRATFQRTAEDLYIYEITKFNEFDWILVEDCLAKNITTVCANDVDTNI
jgi:chromosome segregation ATPase